MENELQLNTGPYKTTFIGLELKRESTEKEWNNYGEILKRIDEAKQWAIGDWLCDGKKHYGDGLYEKASEVLGIEKRTLENIKQISDKFEITRRHVNVSYSHYCETSSLKTIESTDKGKMQWSKDHDIEKAQEFLKRAEKENLSVRELREIVQGYKSLQDQMIRMANEPEKYQVIYADPPWKYNDEQETEKLGGAKKHYSLMTIDELCKLNIASLACENSVLFIWVTSPILEECFKVINQWGFKYKSSFVWDKVKHNMGHYNSVRHEFLLIATKGSSTPDNVKLYDSVQQIERSDKHSEKPHEFYEIIETLYKGKKVELFARNKKKGWDSWGNE